jgi:probable rRNA maturation factor
MVNVSVSKQSNYAVSSAVIKKRLSAFLSKQGIVSSAEVSVAIVGEKKMLEIQKRYFREDDPTSPFGFRGASKKLHNVLSFTPTETKLNFVFPPDGIIHLGEIVVCYPLAVKEAGEENVLTIEHVCELVEHGALHLLGIHHEG